MCPLRNFNLGDLVVVEFVRLGTVLKDLGDDPTEGGIDLAELGTWVSRQCGVRPAVYREDGDASITQAVEADLTVQCFGQAEARVEFAVESVIAERVSGSLVTEITEVVLLRAENLRAHSGMNPVGADEQIGIDRRPVAERRAHAGLCVLYFGDR